jgi:hypothetical protein
MPTTGNRKLTLADGMIVIAALAAWFALIRMTLPLGRYSPSVTLNLLFPVVDSLAPLSVTWLAIRVRQPRPCLRRLARQPGFAACAVLAVTTTMIGVAGLVLNAFHDGWIRPDIMVLWLIAAHCVGFAVVGSWLTLLLVGCWRPGPDWFDRTGRALAVVSILWLLTSWILQITTWL